MRKLSYLLMLLMTCASSVAFAQQRTITGTVSDDGGSPLAGVMVSVQGAQIFTITEAGGNYSIAGPADATLEFNLLGFTPQAVATQGRTVVNVTLAVDATAIDDVVVVGYGTTRKANLTGSVTQVSSEMLQSRPVQNVSSALQGLMPGVTVMSAQGKPGQDGATIRIRGRGTINSSDPYILIDGVESATMNELDPNDIETISVLKDASSAAIYGSKAANGVILITTKRGNVGRAQISYNGDVSIQNATNLIQRMGSPEYAELFNLARTEAGQAARWTAEEIQKFRDGSDPNNYPNTDWYGLAFKTGVQHKHNVNITGGTENSRYMVSAGYLNQKGILAHMNRDQFQARTNVDTKLNNRLNARMNLAFVSNEYTEPNDSYPGVYGGTDQIIRQLNIISPWIPNRYKDVDGNEWYGTIGDGNPIAWLDSGQTIDRRNKSFTGIVSLDYKIAEGLVATASGGYVYDMQEYTRFNKYYRYNPTKETDPAQNTQMNTIWERTNFDLLLNYDKSFGDHNLKLLGGWHTEAYDWRRLEGFRQIFPNNELTDMNAGGTTGQTTNGYTRRETMVSGFGRAMYNYAGKYMLEANFRADASSRFSPDTRWGYFPSFSAGWRISEENFMEGTRGWLTNLKLRGSWGRLGNQNALGSDYYPWVNTYNLTTTANIGGAQQTGYALTAIKNPVISWEETRTWDIGLDVTLIGKIEVILDYYNKLTTGMLQTITVPTEFGNSGYIDNIGSMSNKGFEISVGYNDRWGDWSLSANANFSYNKNKVLSLVNDAPVSTGTEQRFAVGQESEAHFLYKSDGLFASDAEAAAYFKQYAQAGHPFGSNTLKGGDVRLVDTNNDGKIDASDRIYFNSTVPSKTFGLNFVVGWKNLDLSMVWNGAASAARLFTNEVYGDFVGDTSHPSTIWRDSWTFNKENPKMPRIALDRTSPSHYANIKSDYWLENMSYVRLKNLQVGYNFPEKWISVIGLSRVRVYYSGENLFTFDKMRLSLDPESNNYRSAHVPMIRSHAFGLNITF